MPDRPNGSRQRSRPWAGFGFQLLGALQAILGSLATSMIFLLLYRATRTPLIYGVALGVAVATGLAGGFYLRLLLKKSLPIIQSLAAILAGLCGLIAFDLILNLETPARAAPALPGWALIVQTGLTGISAWLALNAWSKTRLKKLRKHAQLQRAKNEKRRKSKLKHRNKIPRASSPISRASASVSTRAQTQTVLRVRPSSKPSTPPQPKQKRSRKVSVARFEEHRCPYCLEEVIPNDPRGVKVCAVCGAWHHQDCWDITGHCQVPHSGNAHA